MESINVRILLMTEGRAYVVQCLEHDIAAQGTSAQDAVDSFLRSLAGECIAQAEENNGYCGPENLKKLPPAPDAYHHLYLLASDDEDTVKVEIRTAKKDMPEQMTTWTVEATIRQGLSPYTKMAQA
jgi:hypothetical protein